MVSRLDFRALFPPTQLATTMMNTSNPVIRINHALLTQYEGQTVAIIGKVLTTSPQLTKLEASVRYLLFQSRVRSNVPILYDRMVG